MKFSILQEAQQFGLQVRGHVPDLVQEEGAFIGHLDFSFLLRRRSREGAFFMAEQFVFEQGLG